MKILAIKCKKCGDIIYSRTRRDFRWCSCKTVAIDGGFEYRKICGNLGEFQEIEIDVDATHKELLVDWDKAADKFGLIKNVKAKTNSKSSRR